MNIKIVFNTLIDSIESHHTLKSLGMGLYKTKLIPPSVHLDSDDARTELKVEITRAKLNGTTSRKSLKISKLSLSKIYLNKQHKANKIFYLSLIAVGISLALIIIGAIIALTEKSQVKLGIIISTSSMFPGFISGAAFWFYKNEDKNLKPVEQDIRKIARLELFLEMTRYISDKKQKSKAYENIIRQMDSRGRFLIL